MIPERAGARALVVGTYVPLLAGNVKKVGFGGYLIGSDGSKRLEWFTHKLLVEKLGTFVSGEKLGAGRYRFAFADRRPVWVLWGEAPGAEEVTLDLGPTRGARITRAIPKLASGREIPDGADYQATFASETRAVAGGKLTLLLDNEPVLVEEAEDAMAR